MSPVDDTRDKVIALERDVRHLSDEVTKLTLAVDGLTNVLANMKGGRALLLAVVTAAGTLGAAIAQAVPWANMFR